MNKGEIAIALLILATILVLNLMATWAILRDQLCERVQRVAQIGLVWLFPLLGALLVLTLYREPKKSAGVYPVDATDDYSLGTGDPYKGFPD